MIVASAAMRRVLADVERIAPTPHPVLILGESGTGKELVARAIHAYSARASKPWIDVSCGAMPAPLMESELFGYEKGAFSGADSAKPGMFELAQGGTLFLDEIGELDAKMQVKLLRVLDGATYFRLGGVRKIQPDARITAATNRDLGAGVKDGSFREDLYFRLGAFLIRVPPLRERPEDIEPLARHWARQSDPAAEIADTALRQLRTYAWPGNVRELRNVMTRAAVMRTGRRIEIHDLALPLERSAAPGKSLDAMEQRLIEEALQATGGHQGRAAESLGISTRTLSRKLKVYEHLRAA